MRAGIYIRVSSEEQVDGFSLDAQRRILTEHCASKGWMIADEYADEGRSARGDTITKRLAFKRLMDDAGSGLIDVVVVHKLDRFARNIRVTFEYLELLARNNVRFVAVAQDVDYTKPEGRMFMGMLATLAQYYSDNLAHETKKGKAERKAQGLYNGSIPFGMMKDSDGVPVADPATIEGLRFAFALGAQGDSDRAIAQKLNEQGFRTSGTHGRNPFSKDTVRAMLLNRFYLGELPGQRPATAAPVKHQAVIERELWDAAQTARERRALTPRGTTSSKAMTYSLSGLAICKDCDSTLHIQPARGKPRIYCSGRRQGSACTSTSALLADLDQQLNSFLSTFHIPADYQRQLADYLTHEVGQAQNSEGEHTRLTGQLERLKELYLLGDITKTRYLSERERLAREVAIIEARAAGQGSRLGGLAKLLGDVTSAWESAAPAQRNRLARLLFEEVVVQSKVVVAVKPRPELAGFFLLDQQVRGNMYRTGGPDGLRLSEFDTSSDDTSHQTVSALPIYFPVSVPPQSASACTRQRRIPPDLWPEIRSRSKHESLRQLAADYGVSHEAVRRILRAKTEKQRE